MELHDESQKALKACTDAAVGVVCRKRINETLANTTSTTTDPLIKACIPVEVVILLESEALTDIFIRAEMISLRTLHGAIL